MKHAFLVNAHKDIAQADQLAAILRKYSGPSGRMLYFDGPPDCREVNGKLWDVLIPADYEPDKCKSILKAMSALFAQAKREGYTHVSFLHSDMVPTDWNSWRRFLERFSASGLALVHGRMWPDHLFIDACNLHFNVLRAAEMGLFPVTYGPLPPQWGDCNESQITANWTRAYPLWHRMAYHVWTIVWPYTGLIQTDQGPIVKMGHTAKHKFTFHNFTPETSVIHANDSAFWNAYEEIVR